MRGRFVLGFISSFMAVARCHKGDLATAARHVQLHNLDSVFLTRNCSEAVSGRPQIACFDYGYTVGAWFSCFRKSQKFREGTYARGRAKDFGYAPGLK
jgi:hypothetical protein